MTECASLSRSIAEAYKRGNKVLICGNGGLAAESEHFAAELMGKYGRDVFIPCISLTGPSSLITALGNDIGFEDVFGHQVEALGRAGDIFIGMTTSRSVNIIHALNAASAKGLEPFLIWHGGVIYGNCHPIQMMGSGVAQIQENIIKFLHQVALEAKELASEVEHV
jgi:D-sedoheptulose 7-phosphate isomerase